MLAGALLGAVCGGLVVALMVQETAPPAPAEPITHTVYILAAANEQLLAVPKEAVAAFCATSWYASDQERAVYVQALRPARTETNPVCEPGEAAILVRPACVFNLLEFLGLRVRAPYVVLLCHTPTGERGGFGIPLEGWARPPRAGGGLTLRTA